MDAATLYVMLTMSDGSQTTSAQGYPSLQACAAGMEVIKDIARSDREAPIQGYWCVENRPDVDFIACGWRDRGCEDFTMWSRQGCTTLRWITRMRKPYRRATCYVNGEDATGDPHDKPRHSAPTEPSDEIFKP
jgi:hypothetical protein